MTQLTELNLFNMNLYSFLKIVLMNSKTHKLCFDKIYLPIYQYFNMYFHLKDNELELDILIQHFDDFIQVLISIY